MEKIFAAGCLDRFDSSKQTKINGFMNIQFVPLDLCEILLEIGNGGMKASNRLRSVICDFTAGFWGKNF